MRKLVLSSLFLATISILCFTQCGTAEQVKEITEINRPLAGELEIFWELKENGHLKQAKCLTSFTIKNNSNKDLQKNWAIYFHQPRLIDQKSTGENFKITHISGDYFKLEPTAKFAGLKKGESVEVQFVNDAWMLKLVDAPTGIYIVFSDDKGVESAPEVIENISWLPIENEKQTSIDGTIQLDVPTGASIYAINKNTQFSKVETLCPITPTPISYVSQAGVLALTNGNKISFATGLENEAKFLAEKFKQDFGVSLSLAEAGKVDGIVHLTISDKLIVDGKKKEAYELVVSANAVKITGSDASGVFYAIQSLRAMVPVQAYASKNANLKLPLATVKDAPRFEYRGMHLDVVRNFQKKEAVLKVIDLMGFYKLNKFHFHISDDEGWRLEIPGLAELTEIGSKRGHTKDESDMLNPAYGSGPYPSKESNGSGFYTKAEFIEILNYAKARHIEVIPELDFPGHARAAIVSMKARQKKLLKAGKTKEANQYILHDPNDASTYNSVQNYDDNVACVCQESTFDFIEKVVNEVTGMYKTAGLKLNLVHIGGDEVPHDVWVKSPKCKNFMAKSADYKKAEDLFYYFVDRFSNILQKNNIVTGGWEEIGLKKSINEDGDIVPVVNEKFLNKNFHPYVWNTVWNWGAEDRGYKLANAGYKVVLSNVNNLYFDLSYDKDPNDPGYYWGGFVDTKKAWGFIPFNIYNEAILNNFNNPLPETLKNGKEKLTEKGKQNILGIQGQLWSETVKGSQMMEYYLFPKMLGLVERAWAKDPSWSNVTNKVQKEKLIQQDWNVFASKLGFFELQRLSYINGGLNTRISPAGAIIENGKLMINTEFPGFTVHYTIDGSEPTAQSSIYTQAVDVAAGSKVKVKVFNTKGQSSRTTILK